MLLKTPAQMGREGDTEQQSEVWEKDIKGFRIFQEGAIGTVAHTNLEAGVKL